MKIKQSTLLFLLICVFSTIHIFSQTTVEFRISEVSTELDDMDGLFDNSDPVFCYQILDNTFFRFGESNAAYSNENCLGIRTINDTFFSETYFCNAPTSYNFSWRGRENDDTIPGDVNNIIGDAVTALQTATILASDLNLNQSTWTTIAIYTTTTAGLSCDAAPNVTYKITLQYKSSFTASITGINNNIICDAIDLGTLNTGSTIGNSNLSNYSNICADNLGDPNPWGGKNEQGVWFKFTTGTNQLTLVDIIAKNDPESLGNQIDLQIALYKSDSNDCSGNLTLIEEDYQGLGLVFDETMNLQCLEASTTYFLLVDGEELIVNNGGQEGYFGLQITDSGKLSVGDEICIATDLGQVPTAGLVGTTGLNYTNICATNLNDPIPTNWTPNNSVWFKFQAPASGKVNIEAQSDEPFPTGTDSIDIELALYGTNSGSGNCNDSLIYISDSYNNGSFNESLIAWCLVPNNFYWVLLDGSNINETGIFNFTISDYGAITPPSPEPNVTTLPIISNECENPSITPPTAKDFCSNTITGSTNFSFLNLTNGTQTIEWTYTDENGEETLQSQIINTSLINKNVEMQSGDLIATESDNSYTYTWYDCSDLSGPAVAFNRLFENPSPSKSYLVEINSGNCIVRSDCISTSTLSTIENNSNEDFKIFPNPTIGNINIELPSYGHKTTLTLYNIQGKKLLSKKYINTKNINLFFEGESGIYYIHIELDNNLYDVLKLIKD